MIAFDHDQSTCLSMRRRRGTRGWKIRESSKINLVEMNELDWTTTFLQSSQQSHLKTFQNCNEFCKLIEGLGNATGSSKPNNTFTCMIMYQTTKTTLSLLYPEKRTTIFATLTELNREIVIEFVELTIRHLCHFLLPLNTSSFLKI